MKTVLITGANKSIGFETAKGMAALGYYVFLGSRDQQRGAEAAEKLNALGITQFEFVQIDVTNHDSIEAAKNVVEQKTGSLDVLINNAGVSGGFPQPPLSTPLSKIRDVFDTNLFGTIDVTLAFIDLLKKSPEPRIVNVTSGLASLTLHGDPSWKYYQFKGSAYGPSKTALNAYTIALAYELRETSFKVNVIDPGFTATDFNNFRGTGDVKDAAAFVIKYATIGPDGPTGRYFSKDHDGGDESPW